ncbi:class I SAM-dependent methyltransferase [Gelidibacter maritimus]|uniref:Class I SAM-dependent methyltransferase n=1 Tax=Gelidibacter maritimus TaxID=2761487 RepID=A0A7W2M7B0_9FLAO|nr:class I SAM-dependent methyltransferase [Gelidibacter maritimus]MBA6153993.1 class I SAM-dependent methyltransferase [Gelidibacter maritimus]
MEEFWNNRYKEKEFAYGTHPNVFFKNTIDKLNLDGTLLLPAEGEGRNAVYAAKKGLEVIAFDISEEGRNKAMELARSENVKIDYRVGELNQLDLKKNSFDALALIYAHFAAHEKEKLHQDLAELIKPNGYLILEGFSVNNLELREKNPKVGGPANREMLYTKQEIKDTFIDFEIIHLEETLIELKEGNFHNGLASVIRFIGKKKA